MSDEDTFEVSFASGRRVNMDDVRRQRKAFMPDGEHAWVISVIYAVPDPEKAMDEMELGADEFVGVSGIYCLVCQTVYERKVRYHKCPQQLADANG